jgi:cytochrome c oxidase subunit 2
MRESETWFNIQDIREFRNHYFAEKKGYVTPVPSMKNIVYLSSIEDKINISSCPGPMIREVFNPYRNVSYLHMHPSYSHHLDIPRPYSYTYMTGGINPTREFIGVPDIYKDVWEGATDQDEEMLRTPKANYSLPETNIIINTGSERSNISTRPILNLHISKEEILESSLSSSPLSSSSEEDSPTTPRPTYSIPNVNVIQEEFNLPLRMPKTPRPGYTVPNFIPEGSNPSKQISKIPKSIHNAPISLEGELDSNKSIRPRRILDVSNLGEKRLKSSSYSNIEEHNKLNSRGNSYSWEQKGKWKEVLFESKENKINNIKSKNIYLKEIGTSNPSRPSSNPFIKSINTESKLTTVSFIKDNPSFNVSNKKSEEVSINLELISTSSSKKVGMMNMELYSMKEGERINSDPNSTASLKRSRSINSDSEFNNDAKRIRISDSNSISSYIKTRAADVPLAWGLYFQDGASPSFEGIVELHNRIMFYLVLILFGVSWVMLSIMANFNKSQNPLVYRYLNHGTLIELIWTVGPALVLVAIAFPSFKLLYLMDEVIDPAMTVKVTGHQWYWQYEYADFLNDDNENIDFDSYMKDESSLEEGELRLLEVDNPLVLPADTHIRFIITGADVIHDWALPSLGIKVDACPGRLNQASVIIERTGIYYGQCSEICGVLHSSMPIKLEAVEVEKFFSWILEQ